MRGLRTGDRFGYTERVNFKARRSLPTAPGTWVEVENIAGFDGTVLVRIGVGEDGRIIASGVLLLKEGELTARDLRRVPIAGTLSSFASAASDPSTYARLFEELLGIPLVYSGEERKLPENAPCLTIAGKPSKLPRAWRALIPVSGAPGTKREPLKRVRPGPKGHTREHFGAVAAAYREVLKTSPRAPIKTLAANLNYSEATIRRHLQRARDMGLLGEARPGKAGEIPREEVGNAE
jgi:hypothetical protein